MDVNKQSQQIWKHTKLTRNNYSNKLCHHFLYFRSFRQWIDPLATCRSPQSRSLKKSQAERSHRQVRTLPSRVSNVAWTAAKIPIFFPSFTVLFTSFSIFFMIVSIFSFFFLPVIFEEQEEFSCFHNLFAKPGHRHLAPLKLASASQAFSRPARSPALVPRPPAGPLARSSTVPFPGCEPEAVPSVTGVSSARIPSLFLGSLIVNDQRCQ